MNENDVLIIIDMQNDFIDGVLGTKEAQAIVPKMVDFIYKFEGKIITTHDTHSDDYLDTQEGKKLPIEHCIYNTEGIKINKDILNAIYETKITYLTYDTIRKNTFGSLDLAEDDWLQDADTIYVCGVCTDICVISNIMILKAAFPEKKIVVLKDLCAGTTPGNHAMALAAMAQCQIDIAKSYEVYEVIKKNELVEKIIAEIESDGAYFQEVNGHTDFVKGITFCLHRIEDIYKKWQEEKDE